MSDADTFRFANESDLRWAGRQNIVDFDPDEGDLLDLSGFGFVFRGPGLLSGSGVAELVYQYGFKQPFKIFGDLDGHGVAEFELSMGSIVPDFDASPPDWLVL